MTTPDTFRVAKKLLNSVNTDEWRYFAHYLAGYSPDTFLHVADLYLRADPSIEQLDAAHTEALAENTARCQRGEV